MKVYVIGKFEEAQRVREAMNLLEINRHTITHDWTGENSDGLVGPERLAYLARCADDDARGVRESQAVLVLHHPQLCGGLVEFGLAIADPHRIICVVAQPSPVARRQPIFYWMPRVRFFADVEDAVLFLNQCEKHIWE